MAPETAGRVRAAIDVIGYRPNLSARALKRGSNQLLGIILSDISNPFFANAASSIAGRPRKGPWGRPRTGAIRWS